MLLSSFNYHHHRILFQPRQGDSQCLLLLLDLQVERRTGKRLR